MEDIDSVVHAGSEVQTVEPISELTKNDYIKDLDFAKGRGFILSPKYFEGTEGAGGFTNSGIQFFAPICICCDFTANCHPLEHNARVQYFHVEYKSVT